MQPKLWIKQVKSVIGQTADTRLRVQGLGLRGVGSEVVVANTPSFRGAIKRVMHLVTVQETSEANVKGAREASTKTPAATGAKKAK